MYYVLVTGGLGYIGSHLCVELLLKNYDVVVIDNNYRPSVINNIQKLSNKQLIFEHCDIRDQTSLEQVFDKYEIFTIFHLAALKSVKESNEKAELYYDVNVNGTKNILKMMKRYHVSKLIYSSSATVYGTSTSPVTESSQTGVGLKSEYAKNKYECEQLLMDYSNSIASSTENTSSTNIVILRYFNPIGNHFSGLIGEDLSNFNNIFPVILNAVNTRSIIIIYGNDYNTPDGTCLRDYIHINDLIDAHILVLKNNSNLSIYNVGNDNPISTLELVQCMNMFAPINYTFGNKRDGDVDIIFADSTKIRKELGWKPNYDISDACRSGLKYIGYN